MQPGQVLVRAPPTTSTTAHGVYVRALPRRAGSASGAPRAGTLSSVDAVEPGLDMLEALPNLIEPTMRFAPQRVEPAMRLDSQGVERTRDPERLQPDHCREHSDDRRGLAPVHRSIVPA